MFQKTSISTKSIQKLDSVRFIKQKRIKGVILLRWIRHKERWGGGEKKKNYCARSNFLVIFIAIKLNHCSDRWLWRAATAIDLKGLIRPLSSSEQSFLYMPRCIAQ